MATATNFSAPLPAVRDSFYQRARTAFFRPVSIAPLATFRVAFGLLMLLGTVRFVALGWVEDHYLAPQFHFKYWGFEWVEPLGAFGMYTVHALMALAAIGVMLGLFYRLSAVALFVTFTYTELIDLTYYLNHYYFVSLAAGLLCLLPAHRSFSIDVLRRPALRCTEVPAWCVGILKAQVAIVYIFAGLAKMNTDWLIRALPLKIWLPAADELPLIGRLFRWKALPWIFSWVGMLYDTLIVFFLARRQTRALAFFTVIVFHVLTGILFQIGVFPLVMIAAALLFFSPTWHCRLQQKIAGLFRRQSTFVETAILYKPAFSKNTVLVLVCTYLLFQILFPWRFLLYPGSLFWTEQGYRFGWRVMLMEKAGTATFYVRDSKTGRQGVVFNGDFLNGHQEKQMAMQPDMILQYAHFLGAHYAERGVQNPQVFAEVWVTLNGAQSQLLIDTTVDLMKVQDNWAHKNWVLPAGK